MDTLINEIISKCNTLRGDEEITITAFGANKDLTLKIIKDSDYDPDIDADYSNLVDIVTLRNDEPVDDATGIYVTDGQLYRELVRIYNYKDLTTL